MNEKKTERRVQVKLLKDQAYEIIKEGIITSTYKPGDELREATLSREIGISKTPIREALIRLKNEGFIMIRPFKGAVVNDISVDDVAKLYEFRRIIETHATRVAAKTCSTEDIEYLRKQVEVMKESVKKDDTEGYHTAHNNFHYYIIGMLENKWINKALSNMEDYAKRVRDKIIKDARVDFIKDYEIIVDALERGDGILASETIDAHLIRIVGIFRG